MDSKHKHVQYLKIIQTSDKQKNCSHDHTNGKISLRQEGAVISILVYCLISLRLS